MGPMLLTNVAATALPILSAPRDGSTVLDVLPVGRVVLAKWVLLCEGALWLRIPAGFSGPSRTVDADAFLHYRSEDFAEILSDESVPRNLVFCEPTRTLYLAHYGRVVDCYSSPTEASEVVDQVQGGVLHVVEHHLNASANQVWGKVQGAPGSAEEAWVCTSAVFRGAPLLSPIDLPVGEPCCVRNVNTDPANGGQLPIHQSPSPESPLVGWLPAFIVVQSMSSTLLPGSISLCDGDAPAPAEQGGASPAGIDLETSSEPTGRDSLWLELSPQFRPFVHGWVCANHAGRLQVESLPLEVEDPSLGNELWYRNVLQKAALPFREDPILQSRVLARLPLGSCIRGLRRLVTKESQLWAHCYLPGQSEPLWAVERNARDGSPILLRVRPPQGQCRAVYRVVHSGPLPMLTYPFFGEESREVDELEPGEYFVANERRLNERFETWVGLVHHRCGQVWVPESIGGVANSIEECLEVNPDDDYLSDASSGPNPGPLEAPAPHLLDNGSSGREATSPSSAPAPRDAEFLAHTMPQPHMALQRVDSRKSTERASEPAGVPRLDGGRTAELAGSVALPASLSSFSPAATPSEDGAGGGSQLAFDAPRTPESYRAPPPAPPGMTPASSNTDRGTSRGEKDIRELLNALDAFAEEDARQERVREEARKAQEQAILYQESRHLQATSPPVLSPPGGRYFGPLTVFLQSGEDSGRVYYTTDGSTPNPRFALTEPLEVDIGVGVTHIRAVAILPGREPSQVVHARFIVYDCPVRCFTPLAGLEFVQQLRRRMFWRRRAERAGYEKVDAFADDVGPESPRQESAHQGGHSASCCSCLGRLRQYWPQRTKRPPSSGGAVGQKSMRRLRGHRRNGVSRGRGEYGFVPQQEDDDEDDGLY
uniref:GH29D-like beta-sandwich domain-containing protein n=1 Tax=Rhizochromulina marina TaxID=1034831 RepID=A0A7S2SIP2_9STRA